MAYVLCGGGQQAKLVMAGDSEASVPMVDPNKMNLVAEVSTKEPKVYNKVSQCASIAPQNMQSQQRVGPISVRCRGGLECREGLR